MSRGAALLWPFGRYRDADRGSPLERSAAQRHNRALSRDLPAYMNRWALMGAVQLILTQTIPGIIGAFFGVLFTISFCAVVHFAHVWLLFRRLS